MKTKVKSTIDERVKKYVSEETKLLKSLGLAKRLLILFPHKRGRNIPFLSRIAVAVLRSQGGIIDVEFSEIKQ